MCRGSLAFCSLFFLFFYVLLMFLCFCLVVEVQEFAFVGNCVFFANLSASLGPMLIKLGGNQPGAFPDLPFIIITNILTVIITKTTITIMF